MATGKYLASKGHRTKLLSQPWVSAWRPEPDGPGRKRRTKKRAAPEGCPDAGNPAYWLLTGDSGSSR